MKAAASATSSSPSTPATTAFCAAACSPATSRWRDASPQGEAADLPPETWLQLLRLAHDDKRAALPLYAQHYLGTHGQCYWSDTMQQSTYLPSYAEYLERARGDGAQRASAPKETLVIGEHYVPRQQLMAFMQRARAILRAHGSEVIYGTIRSILRDTVSFLPWAKDDFACVVFNLRTLHTAAGIERTAATFRALTDASLALGGSFYLTYHRHATAAQVEAAYPRFRRVPAAQTRARSARALHQRLVPALP